MNPSAYNQLITGAEQHFGRLIQRTNEAIENLRLALGQEIAALSAFLQQDRAAIEQLEVSLYSHARQQLSQMHSTGAGGGADADDYQLSHLNELLSHYAALKSNLSAIVSAPRQTAPPAFGQEEQIQQQLREAKRNLLKLKYSKEELEIDGASPSVVAAVDSQVATAQSIVANLQRQLAALEQDAIDESTKENFPELQVYAQKWAPSRDPRIPTRFVDNKLELKRQLKDYIVIQTLSPRVQKVQFAGEFKVLKQFSFGDDVSRRQFIKEVNALHKLNHPSIVKIEGFFVEPNGQVFVQMPFLSQHSLADWLAESVRSPLEIRHVFRAIAYALCHMHDRGICHLDLKLTNVIMLDSSVSPGSTQVPVIIDFDTARDLQASLTTATSTFSNNNVVLLAPELVNLMSQGRTSQQALSSFNYTGLDWWAFGVLLYQTILKREPVLLPNSDGVKVPSVDNMYLRDLLERLLKRDPGERLTPNEVLQHPFFTVSADHEFRQTGALVPTEIKLEVFNRFLFLYRRNQKNQYQPRIHVQLRREHLVDDTLHVFRQLKENEGGPGLLQQFRVEFLGEQGVDLGGLTQNMYLQFFREVVEDQYDLFESGSTASEGSSSSIFYLPKRCSFPRGSSEYIEHLAKLEAVGKAIIKSIYDQCTIPEVFPSVLWKFLCDNVDGNSSSSERQLYTFRDLEIFDSQLALSLSKLMSCSNIDEWGLTFEDVDDGDDATPVTVQNRAQYVQLKTRYVLLGSRIEELHAIRRGFQSLREVSNQLRILGYRELMYLVHGSSAAYIDAEQIAGILRFDGYAPGSDTPDWLASLIRSFEQQQLRQFLEYVTGSTGLSFHDIQESRKIIVRRCSGGWSSFSVAAALPVAHTCTWTLDLPEYGSVELLRSKLLLALEHGNSSSAGFHFA